MTDFQFQLLAYLVGQQAPVYSTDLELAEKFQVSQSYVAQTLGALRRARLIHSETTRTHISGWNSQRKIYVIKETLS